MKTGMKLKDILLLQFVFLIYSMNSIVAKFASTEEFGLKFILLYGLEVAILGIYAILWQQVIKKFELSVAYANKAVTLIWAMLWGSVLFKEQITVSKVAGILLVITGIVILNSKDREKEKEETV
ncbi:MAG: transporter [Lachnospiraceae bacterium]|nr:transporter [Lachnospiraceae bacterium]